MNTIVGPAGWSDVEAEAWFGLLESHKRLTRALDAELEAREVVRRQACSSDARAVEAHLTDTGLALAREAQATHVASVRDRFLDRLGPGDVEALAAMFRRFSPDGAGACTATAGAQSADV